jgi:hypothetical protein
MITSDPESFLKYSIRQQNKCQYYALLLSSISILKRLFLEATTNNSTKFYMVRHQVLKMTSIKMTAYWYVVPCTSSETEYLFLQEQKLKTSQKTLNFNILHG